MTLLFFFFNILETIHAIINSVGQKTSILNTLLSNHIEKTFPKIGIKTSLTNSLSSISFNILK